MKNYDDSIYELVVNCVRKNITDKDSGNSTLIESYIERLFYEVIQNPNSPASLYLQKSILTPETLQAAIGSPTIDPDYRDFLICKFLFDFQKDIVFSEVKNEIVVNISPRQIGKSVCKAVHVIKTAAARRCIQVYGSTTVTSAKRVLWDIVISLSQEFKFPTDPNKTNKTDGRIQWYNGSKLFFGGFNTSERDVDNFIRGIGEDLDGGGITIDEVGAVNTALLRYAVERAAGPIVFNHESTYFHLQGTPARTLNHYSRVLAHRSKEEDLKTPPVDRYHKHYVKWTRDLRPGFNDKEKMARIMRQNGWTEKSAAYQIEYEANEDYLDFDALVLHGRQTYTDMVWDCTGEYDTFRVVGGKYDGEEYAPYSMLIGKDNGGRANTAVIPLLCCRNTKTQELRGFCWQEAMWSNGTVSKAITHIKNLIWGDEERHLLPDGRRNRKWRAFVKPQRIKADEIAWIDYYVVHDWDAKEQTNEMRRVHDINCKKAHKSDVIGALLNLRELCANGDIVMQEGKCTAYESDNVIYKRDDSGVAEEASGFGAIIYEIDEGAGIHPDAIMALCYASRDMVQDMLAKGKRFSIKIQADKQDAPAWLTDVSKQVIPHHMNQFGEFVSDAPERETDGVNIASPFSGEPQRIPNDDTLLHNPFGG